MGIFCISSVFTYNSIGAIKKKAEKAVLRLENLTERGQQRMTRVIQVDRQTTMT